MTAASMALPLREPGTSKTTITQTPTKLTILGTTAARGALALEEPGTQNLALQPTPCTHT